LSEENEKIYQLRHIYNQDMEAYIQYYDSDEWSEEQEKDFDDDGVTEMQTFNKKDFQESDDYSGISEKILSPPGVISPKN
jgi:hypothetical protein